MTNIHRGKVSLEIDGKPYTLSFSFNALCELEENQGRSVESIGQELSDRRGAKLTTLRALMWAALRDHHPEVTVTDAGGLIEAGGLSVVGEALGRAFVGAFPDIDKEQPGSRPTKKKAVGTGSRS